VNGTPPPVTLRLPSVAGAPAVTGSVVLALALKAGFPPLAADRAGRAAANAVRSAGRPVLLAAWAGDGELAIELSGEGSAWQDGAAEVLADYAAVVADGKVSVVFRGPPRAAIGHV
jgi:hypothetical protein